MAGYDIEDLEVENVDVEGGYDDEGYEEEYEEVSGFGPYDAEAAEEKWKDKTFEELVDEMSYLVSSGKKYLFFSKTKRVVNGQEIDLLAKYIEEKFPEEFVIATDILSREEKIISDATAKAESTIAEAERIMADTKVNSEAYYNDAVAKAKAEAEAIIQRAQATAHEMVQEHSITRMAREESERIKAETDKTTKQMIAQATTECETLREQAKAYAVAIVQSAYAFIKKGLVGYQSVAAQNIDTIKRVYGQFEEDFAVQTKNLGISE